MADTIAGNTTTTSTLYVNSWAFSSIDSWGDADWWRTSLTSGYGYIIEMRGWETFDGTLYDPWIGLTNSFGTLLTYDDDSGYGLNSLLYWAPSSTGTYYIRAEETGNNETGSYLVSITSDFLANTSSAAYLSIGSSIQHAIDFVGDSDWVRVSLTAGQTYRFDLVGGTLADPMLELLDSSGGVLGWDDDSGLGLDASLTYTPSVSGTYYLSARESGNNATGSYTLYASAVPTISITDGGGFETDIGQVNATFTVTLSSAVAWDVTVYYSTADSTAQAGSDYLARNSYLTILAGSTSANITVPIIGDTIFEPSELFSLNLFNPSGAVLADSGSFWVIGDDDNPYIAYFPSDRYLTLQWYLYDDTGINVFPVWDEYSGAGVQVAVFDQGIDPLHPDLDGNLLTGLGVRASTLAAGGAPILYTDNHGTAVAGVIAGERDGSGIVGVAYGANLISIYDSLAFGTLTSQTIANAYTYAANFDVLNDSWGFANGFSSGITWAFYDNFLSPSFSAAGAALANLAANGRNGLGTVVVQSAGNSFALGDDTNLHNFQNSQYIITVAATDYNGDVTDYSSPGASILVAAPGGGGSGELDLSDVFTTDRVGTAGYETSNYGTISGTSFSAPIVSGVVALMLEANPNLGYRDVQEILAYSARETSSANNDWEYNGASNWNGGGLHYDAWEHDLGFGLVDAHAAVRLAETWSKTSHTATNRQQVTQVQSPGFVIPDNSFFGATDFIAVTQAIDVERVEVTLNVTHPFIGDLGIYLVSPSGTGSWLLWRPQQNALSAYGTDQNDIHFTFSTVLNWGESSVGSWSLTVYDLEAGDTGRFDSWALNLIGKPQSADDTYIYTDEYASVSSLDGRNELVDTAGNDTLNAAAVTFNSTINLNPGTASTIAGAGLLISANTLIENAIGGDGNDTLIGNTAGNTLCGMHGNDTLNGGAGLDTAVFTGGRANYNIWHSNSSFTITDTLGTDGIDTLSNIERLQFTDKKIALDLAPTDNAGQAVLFIGVLAPDLVATPGTVGLIIDFVDDGMSMQQLNQLAVNIGLVHDLAGGSSDADVASMAFENVVGVQATPDMIDLLVGFMDGRSANLTQSEFLTAVANLEVNQANVDLVGLAQAGIEYAVG